MAVVAYANLKLVPGRGQPKKFHFAQMESWTTEQSIDNDVDSFSVNLGDPMGDIIGAVDRDTEVQVDLFCSDGTGAVKQCFSGLCDVDTLATSKTHTIQGGDVPSSILMASDAAPGYWRHVTPKNFLTSRAKALGLSNLQIADMPEIGRLWSDASEKEWAFWYRIARMGGCYMWSTDDGGLVVDSLAYSDSTYSYSFGVPPKSQSPANWIPCSDISVVSNKQQRIAKVIVYGEDKKKKGVVPLATAVNPSSSSIASWLRKPTTVSTLTTARTQKELGDEADLEIFESIVGAQEFTLTVDGRLLIQQNKMARVNLPDYGIEGTYYVVGVTRRGGDSAIEQDVRLREKGFAIDKRVPTAPSLGTQPNLAGSASTANIAQGLQGAGVRWYQSFVKAAREFLSGPGTQGWDLAISIGVLLSICSVESSFKNVRQGDTLDEWRPMPTDAGTPYNNANPINAGTPGTIFDPTTSLTHGGTASTTLAAQQQEWRKMFANSAGNPLNPFSGEAGTGPMQLTTAEYKVWADNYGFNDKAKVGEYDGGRWNPDSNIRASARALAGKLRTAGADPTNPGTIWAGVAAYNGSGDAAKTYSDKVKKEFDSTYGPKAQSAVDQSPKTTPGSAQRTFKDTTGKTIVALPDNTPDAVAKAVTWFMSKRGDPYQWGGAGNPGYDCSSACTEALVIGDPTLRNVLDAPNSATGHHGETTFTLWDKGIPVPKTNLLPGDLVFFDGITATGASESRGHVGMFVGGGQFIHDPQTGESVKISSLNDDYFRSRYDGARRFLNWNVKPSG